jgi:hypothetical protein
MEEVVGSIPTRSTNLNPPRINQLFYSLRKSYRYRTLPECVKARNEVGPCSPSTPATIHPVREPILIIAVAAVLNGFAADWKMKASSAAAPIPATGAEPGRWRANLNAVPNSPAWSK